MTNHQDPNIGRRPVLKGAGVTLGTLGGLTGSVAADHDGEKGKGGHLADSEAEFVIYWSNKNMSATDPDSQDDFGFPKGSPLPPGGPFLRGTDPDDGEDDANGLFDARDIEISPNQQTLHHSLRFFAGLLMKGKAKPYTLVNVGDGVFESRGQVTNFEARSTKSMERLLDRQDKSTELVEAPPLKILAGGKWRAVATDGIKVDLSSEEPPFDVNWAVTRVDFYSRGGGKPQYTLSLLYRIWNREKDGGFDGAFNHSAKLIAQGRLNQGGQ